MKPDWILIANASEARLLQQEQGEAMVVLEAFHHERGRMKAGDLTDDKAGRDMGSSHFGGSPLQPRSDAHHKERTAFANELAQRLEVGAQLGHYASLQVFASSPFLGNLKQALGHATTRLLAGTHDLDLTHEGLDDVERHAKRVQGKGR